MDRLAAADLDRFLQSLARRLPCPARLVLTGGGEAMVLGGVRPTGDLDFALVVAEQLQAHWPALEAAVAAARDDAGIAVQYAADIDRWSSVSVPVARRRTRAFRRIGRLSVHLVEPTCWAVYKLARYLDSDVEDLRAVLRRQRVPWRGLARLCGESLRTSPRSTQLRLFRQQVEHFFRTYGGHVWGVAFDAERAIGMFRRAAGIPSN
jgi:hypothetical protein